MEQAGVVIIGAGPAGLVAGLTLAEHGIKSIILEKESEIAEDPRGVYLAGDAVRILYSIGLGRSMRIIGHELHSVNFHSSSFANPPLYSIDVEKDVLQQAVSTGILQIQPALGTDEKALRDAVDRSHLCDLRTGCEALTLQHDEDEVELGYRSPDGSNKKIKASWLIGADGKRGVVRKNFLEKVADVRQIHTDYRYEGTWVAANLKIRLITPQSHPDFPAWKLGLTPQEVYDLFWPKGWHFCSPPGKPTASGRFGPHDQRMWRHEFAQDDWNDEMDADRMLFDHLTPMVTRTHDDKGRRFDQCATYPRDCIEIQRCRPFKFTHKVVNRWFFQKIVLIGDAAHVFPPFGGQGIASGIRDAHQLAWRIALIEHTPASTLALSTESILQAWATERTKSVKDAAFLTSMNGMLANNPYSARLLPLISYLQQLAVRLLGPNAIYDPQSDAEQKGLSGLPGGFFLSRYGGGVRLPQLYVDTILHGKVLSDTIFKSTKSVMHILILVRGNNPLNLGRNTIREMLKKTAIPPSILSHDATSILSLDSCPPESIGSCALPTVQKASLTPLRRLNRGEAKPGYSMTAFQSRLAEGTEYVIVRPDFYVFATARDLGALEVCFNMLRGILEV